MASKPICIDLFCGLGGWAEGFLSEGYDVIGFDIERHRYSKTCPQCRGTGNFYGNDEDGDFLECDCYEDLETFGKVWDQYPGQLVLQDVLTLHGSQFRNADVIVASPPCQEFSYWHQFSWKAPTPDLGVRLFRKCFDIAEEAGRPLIVENVVGAQRWIGRSAWHYGSFYLWGDVPALMLNGSAIKGFKNDMNQTPFSRFSSRSLARKTAVAQISKIPFPLAQYIAQVFKPSVANKP